MNRQLVCRGVSNCVGTNVEPRAVSFSPTTLRSSPRRARPSWRGWWRSSARTEPGRWFRDAALALLACGAAAGGVAPPPRRRHDGDRGVAHAIVKLRRRRGRGRGARSEPDWLRAPMHKVMTRDPGARHEPQFPPRVPATTRRRCRTTQGSMEVGDGRRQRVRCRAGRLGPGCGLPPHAGRFCDRPVHRCRRRWIVRRGARRQRRRRAHDPFRGGSAFPGCKNHRPDQAADIRGVPRSAPGGAASVSCEVPQGVLGVTARDGLAAALRSLRGGGGSLPLRWCCSRHLPELHRSATRP